LRRYRDCVAALAACAKAVIATLRRRDDERPIRGRFADGTWASQLRPGFREVDAERFGRTLDADALFQLAKVDRIVATGVRSAEADLLKFLGRSETISKSIAGTAISGSGSTVFVGGPIAHGLGEAAFCTAAAGPKASKHVPLTFSLHLLRSASG
jgi:hypothetical protein